MGPYIIFADANVKAVCVAKWDTNGDGELAYEEAAAVSYLGTAFRDKTQISSFDELQYFTGLININYNAFSSCSSLTSITIPNNVTTIGNNAFYGCSSLTSVTLKSNAFVSASRTSSTSMKSIFGEQVKIYILGEDVKRIGNSTFEACSGLTSITIPNSVTIIGNSAFSGCSGLTSITIPNSVTIIGNSAFSGCSGLTSITIPESVTAIGSSAFQGCSSLTSITIPESVTSIGNGAFDDCRGLTSITIPESVTSIGDEAFFNCYSLTSITIPNSVTSISRLCFQNCSSLSSIIISESVTSIGDGAFRNCTSLTSITIPNSVTSIGNGAFSGCSSLTSATIPNSVTSIGDYALSGCSSLTSITIPNSVTSIGDNAFYDCRGLTSIIVESGNTAYDSRDNCNAIIETATNTLVAGCQNTIIPNSVTSIGNHAFYHCTSLTSVTIPDSVTSIGDEAFWYCTNLTSIAIGSGVTSIGWYAFYGCSNLTTVTLDSNAIVAVSRTSETSIESIFGEQVTEYVLGDNINAIGNNAFYGCNAKLCVNRGTDALLAVWNYGVDPYEIDTETKLSRPSISVLSTTQATITYQINNFYPELEYDVVGNPVSEDTYIITDLRPNYTQVIPLTVRSANNSYSTSGNATTSSISLLLTSKEITSSSLTLEGSYLAGDAKVVSSSVIINGTETEGVEGKIHGLNPYTTYNCKFKIVVEYGEGETYTYEFSSNIRTEPLTLTTQQPKVVSMGNAVVAAESNLDDEETNVGFEWRRTDWTDEFASNTGTAYLYEGRLEGYIRNLYTEKLWKYRPYYQSDSGNRYYGEWVGIDPTNTSYFEPTVHTYAQIHVTGNRAEVKGYAMRGTDNVVSQGFMYWPGNTSVSLRKKANSVPDNVTVVNASGNVMTATLEDLEYETTYNYVAFVTTSEGETFYGELQTFSTSIDPDGIEEVKASEDAVEIARYDIQGRKIAKPQKGINIIRYSDGTTRKLLVK